MILGFYEWLIISMFFVVLLLSALAVLSKVTQDKKKAWVKVEKAKLFTEMGAFVSITNKQTFGKRLLGFTEKHNSDVKKRKYRNLLEEVLFEFIAQGGEAVEGSRAIAAAFDFPQQSVVNLKKRSKTKVLYGCIQAKAYLYEPSIPFLLEYLKTTDVAMQYDILLALSRFDDPAVIIEAFEAIEQSLLVNERTVREVIKWMSPQNRIILCRHVVTKGSVLTQTLFLKSVDRETARALKNQIVRIFSEEEDMELCISAVKALSAAQEHVLVPHLITALQHENWEMRAVAAKGLIGLPDERAVQPLLGAICDPRWWVRQNAALALLSFQDPVPGIVEVLKTDDRYAKESLFYAAEQKNMDGLVKSLSENKQSKGVDPSS